MPSLRAGNPPVAFSFRSSFRARDRCAVGPSAQLDTAETEMMNQVNFDRYSSGAIYGAGTSRAASYLNGRTCRHFDNFLLHGGRLTHSFPLCLASTQRPSESVNTSPSLSTIWPLAHHFLPSFRVIHALTATTAGV